MHTINLLVVFTFAGFVPANLDKTNVKINHYFSNDVILSTNIQKQLTADYTSKNGKKVSIFAVLAYLLIDHND